MHVQTLLSKKIKGIQTSFLVNVEGSVELNQSMLCVYELYKGCNLGMTEYTHLELSGSDKGDDQQGNICLLPVLLQLPPLFHLQY